jgi:hypothetical protein
MTDPIRARIYELANGEGATWDGEKMADALRAVLGLHARTDRSWTVGSGPNTGNRVERFECVSCPEEEDFYSGFGATYPCLTVRVIADALGVGAVTHRFRGPNDSLACSEMVGIGNDEFGQYAKLCNAPKWASVHDLRLGRTRRGYTDRMDPLFLLAILVILVFFGLGFAAKIFFWGIVLGLVLLVASAVSGWNRRL